MKEEIAQSEIAEINSLKEIRHLKSTNKKQKIQITSIKDNLQTKI